MYLQPRNFVERVENAAISNDTINTYIRFDTGTRQVRRDDIGKTVMFKSANNPATQDGAGGRIIDITEDNGFKLEASAGLYSNDNADIIITTLDDLKSVIEIPESTTLDVEWQIEPRYL